MLGDAKLAQQFAKELFEAGIHMIGFFYPVVPPGQTRVRERQSNHAFTSERQQTRRYA